MPTQAATPETTRAAGEAALAPTPPPVTAPEHFEDWISTSLLNSIRTMPGNPAVRGMIRNELQIILPQSIMAASNSEHILGWLRDQYPGTVHGRQRAEYEASVAQPRPTLTAARPAPRTTPVAPAEPVPEANYRFLPDGRLVLRNLELSGSEQGNARFRCVIRYRPTPTAGGTPAEVIVPANVATLGNATIRTWLTAHAPDLGLEEYTEDYEHTDFVRDSLSITNLTLDDTELNRVLAARRA